MLNQMVEYREDPLDVTYAALAHPVRRAVLERLRGGEARVTELAVPFAMSLAAVSKHIRVLEEARLVERAVHGREHRLALNPSPLRPAARWLDGYQAFWEDRLDRLEVKLRSRHRR
jgi:DNA-binding transcriptional ArsR family regulator